MMITSWKCRPRNSTGRFWLTELPYQIRPRRLQQSQKTGWRFSECPSGCGFEFERSTPTAVGRLLSLARSYRLWPAVRASYHHQISALPQANWFQVVQGSVSLLACALGLKCRDSEKTGGYSLCSPLLLLKAAGLDWRGPPPVFPVRSRHLGAAFRSPMMTAACGHYGVSVPDLLLRRLVGFSSGPFGPQLLRWYRFAPVPAISTLRARCPDSSPSIPAPPRLRFPFGDLPLRITASTAICRWEAHLPKLPDLPLLPALGMPPAVPHSWLATASQAGC